MVRYLTTNGKSDGYDYPIRSPRGIEGLTEDVGVLRSKAFQF